MWGRKRIQEIPGDSKVAADNKSTEIGKLEDRLKKFTDKMVYLDTCKQKMVTAAASKKNNKSNKVGAFEIA